MIKYNLIFMVSFSWEKPLKKSICAVLVLSVVMPLMVGKEYAFPLAGQIFFIQTVVFMALGLLAGLIFFTRQQYLFKITPLTIALGVFIAGFFISAVFGADWHLSLWGSSYFMKGAVFMLFSFAYYLIMSRVFSDLDDWRWMFRFIAGIGGVVVLLGIAFSEGGLCQLFGQRMNSVFGNPVFLGGYAMMVFFLGILGLSMERSLPWRVFFIIFSSLSFLGVLFSGTRSAILGMAVGLIIILLFYGFKLIKEKKILNEFRWIALIVLITIFFLIIWQAACSFLKEGESPPVTGITRVYSADLGARLAVWKGAIEAWPEKPLFGWGPNNFDYVFSSYYQPEIFIYGEAGIWPEGAWNIWLEALVERGLFGLISLLFMLGAIIRSLFAGYKRGSTPFFVLAIGMAFLFAYLIHLSFIFELISMAMLFFIFLAFINALTMSGTEKDLFLPSTKRYRFFGFGLCVFFLLAAFIFIALLPAVANIAVYSAILLLEDKPVRAMEIYEKTVERIPTPYLYDLKTGFFSEGASHLGKWEREQADRFVRLGLNDLKIKDNRSGPEIFSLLNQAEFARQGSYASDNEILLKDAEKLLEKAHLLSPKQQSIKFSLAVVKAELGNFEKANRFVQEGIEITPTASQGWLILIWLHKMNNDRESAQIVFREAKNRGIIFSPRQIETVEQILSSECCKKGQIF